MEETTLAKYLAEYPNNKPQGERIETVLHVAAKIEPRQLIRMEDVYKVVYTARSETKEVIYTVPLPDNLKAKGTHFSTLAQWVEAELSRIYKDVWELQSITRLEVEAVSLPKAA